MGGTGPLVRMSGEDGEASLLHAAVCICPGFDTGKGQFFQKLWPVANPYLRRTLRSFWLEGKHASVMAACSAKDLRVAASLQNAKEAADLETFYEGLSGLAGFDSVEEMHAATNPILTARGIKKLGLVISAMDDPICT